MTFIIVLLGWIFSLTLHEFAHAYVAYQGGDWTVKEKGYLTFNPLKYTHPVLSILLPILFLFLGGIGLPGGAVYIQTAYLRSRKWETAVSLAGPAMNILTAIVLGLFLQLEPVRNSLAGPALAFLAFLQVSAAFLNLLPIPGLDGYGAFAPYLPWELRQRVDQAAGVGMWILILLMWYVPFFGTLFWGLVNFFVRLLGVPGALVASGYDLFKFW
jgi:Zn-dependent protease